MLTSDEVPAARRVIALDGADLILGNALAVLPQLKGRYDAIVSDPPYGIKYDPSGPLGSAWRDVSGIVGDDAPFDPCPLLSASDGLPTALFGANNFASKLPDSRGWFVWDKRPGMRSLCFSDCELAWSSLDKPARMIRYVWSGANRGPESGEHWHPTQKPIEVMRWLIENLSRPGDVILDPYMGSGTTGVAALQAGRRFIGVEIEERWFLNAEKRLRREMAQGRLF